MRNQYEDKSEDSVVHHMYEMQGLALIFDMQNLWGRVEELLIAFHRNRKLFDIIANECITFCENYIKLHLYKKSQLDNSNNYNIYLVGIGIELQFIVLAIYGQLKYKTSFKTIIDKSLRIVDDLQKSSSFSPIMKEQLSKVWHFVNELDGATEAELHTLIRKLDSFMVKFGSLLRNSREL